jgi:anti-sigma regulatory factor (Ser/Thr protein kinase)
MEGRRLEAKLLPEWDAILPLWDDCHRFLSRHLPERDTVQALCMAVQELLENAVKYGGFVSSEGGKIELAVAVDERAIAIQVRSPPPTDGENLRRLEKTLDRIRTSSSAEEAYVQRLAELAEIAASTTPLSRPPSAGLGLLRVAYEGQCVLDYWLDGANSLAVSAVRLR